MRRFALLFWVVTAVCLCLGSTSPVLAQASRTWVSGVGDDVNPCSRTAPCKTFAGAISKTAALGEINCLDPGGFGSLTITKSIKVDCHEIFGSVLNAGTNGIVIAFDSFTDARKTVRLRNLNFNGVNTGLIGVRIIGGANAANSAVVIEDCVIDGNFSGTARGISDERGGASELYVSNTSIRNMGASAVAVVPTAGARVDAVLDNLRIHNAFFGIAVGIGAKVMVNRSTVSGNGATSSGAGTGLEVDSGGEMNVDNSVISSNGTGVQNSGTIRLSNSDIAFNATGITGTALSYGNNRISGNTAAGTTPTLIGAATPAFGQQ